MPNAEGDLSYVSGFLEAKQTTGRALPRYMLRRASMPGPILGMPYMVTIGPKTIAATTAGQLVFQIPGGVRLIAFGWYSLSSGGASTFRVMRSVTVGSAIAGSTSNVGVQGGASGVLVSTDAAGVAYFNDLTSTYTIVRTVWAGAADSVNSSQHPEAPAFGSSSQRPFLEVRFVTANAVTDFMCWALLVPMRHSNTLRASD